MTDQYIIDGGDLSYLANTGSCYDEEIEEKVRSNPYNPQAERDKVLEALKKDLQTRFISPNNQWSKGRNSGLLECCNIIDEELRSKEEQG